MAEDKYVGYITSRINQKKSFSCDLEKAARYASDLYNSNGSFLLIWHEENYILFVCEAKANKNGICVRIISYKVFSDKDGIISEINGLPKEKKKAIYFYGEIDEFKSSFGRDDIVILEKEKFQNINEFKSKVWFEDFVKDETKNKLQIGMEHCTIFKFFKTDSEKRTPIYIYVPLDQATLDSSFYEDTTWREILPNENEDCQIAGVKCKCTTIEMNVDVFNNVFCMVTDLSGESKYSLVHNHLNAKIPATKTAKATAKTTKTAATAPTTATTTNTTATTPTTAAPAPTPTPAKTSGVIFSGEIGTKGHTFEKMFGYHLNESEFVIFQDTHIWTEKQLYLMWEFCIMMGKKKKCKNFLLRTYPISNKLMFQTLLIKFDKEDCLAYQRVDNKVYRNYKNKELCDEDMKNFYNDLKSSGAPLKIVEFLEETHNNRLKDFEEMKKYLSIKKKTFTWVYDTDFHDRGIYPNKDLYISLGKGLDVFKIWNPEVAKIEKNLAKYEISDVFHIMITDNLTEELKNDYKKLLALLIP